MKSRDLIPPVIASAIRGWFSGPVELYGSYADALLRCSERGYENEDIVEIVVAKTRNYRELLARGDLHSTQINATSSYGLCAILASLKWPEMNIVDFGGGAGAHYLLARAILPPSIRLNWAVVETPAMVQKAKESLSSEELQFHADLAEAASSMGRVDLLHSSGTL